MAAFMASNMTNFTRGFNDYDSDDSDSDSPIYRVPPARKKIAIELAGILHNGLEKLISGNISASKLIEEATRTEYRNECLAYLLNNTYRSHLMLTHVLLPNESLEKSKHRWFDANGATLVPKLYDANRFLGDIELLDQAFVTTDPAVRNFAFMGVFKNDPALFIRKGSLTFEQFYKQLVINSTNEQVQHAKNMVKGTAEAYKAIMEEITRLKYRPVYAKKDQAFKFGVYKVLSPITADNAPIKS
jgi:hypothetical protein